MAQLAYQTMSVNEIITRALYIVRAESVYQAENQDARQFVLQTLNDILSLWNVEGEMLPFYKVFDFTMTPDVGEYSLGTVPGSTIPLTNPMESIDYVNILFYGFQYAVEIVDNFGWLYNTRALNVTARPAIVWINPAENQFTLRFYPKPDQPYTCQLLYKDHLNSVTYQSSVGLPPAYRTALVYMLAKRVNAEGNYGTWSAENQEILNGAMTILKSGVRTDYRIRSRPPFQPNPGWYTQFLGVVTK